MKFLFILNLFLVSAVFFLFLYFIFFRSKKYSENIGKIKNFSALVSVEMRSFWLWLIEPIYKVLVFLKISPNLLTFVSLLISIIASFLYSRGNIVWASWSLVLAGTCDTLDGHIARQTGSVTKAGEFLDSSLDRFSDIIIFLGILYYFRNDNILYLIISVIIFSSVGISYFKAKAQALGVKNNYGLMQRAERFWILCLFGTLSPLIANFFVVINIHSVNTINVFKFALYLLAVSTFCTALSRLLNGFNSLKKSV